MHGCRPNRASWYAVNWYSLANLKASILVWRAHTAAAPTEKTQALSRLAEWRGRLLRRLAEQEGSLLFRLAEQWRAFQEVLLFRLTDTL